MSSILPAWYKHEKIRRAIYAFEDGEAAYFGYVVDLEDGTCRLINVPCLGPFINYGDRVDLFFNPRDPTSEPYIGYRVYPEGAVPVGTNHGIWKEPTTEQLAKREERLEQKEEAHFNNKLFDAIEKIEKDPSKLSKW